MKLWKSIAAGLWIATTITLPDDSFLVILPYTCVDSTGQVVGPPAPCVALPPQVSTGPVFIKASSGDCYRIDGINPNGTLPKVPGWVPCQ